MKDRLNITIEKSLIARVKKYARENNSSISSLVEEYFEQLTRPVKKTSIADLLNEAQPADYPEGYDYKKDYYKDLGK